MYPASIAAAQLATYSPSEDSEISYAVNVPSASAQSGSGDIFIQIKGPVSGSNARSWIAIGQGSSMPGSNIFIAYPDASGNNVTISPRLGKGFFEPDYNSEAKVELLSGTGIENGMMTANFKCKLFLILWLFFPDTSRLELQFVDWWKHVFYGFPVELDLVECCLWSDQI